VKKSRIGIRRKQRNINIGIAIFFLLILPITAVIIGSRITEWWVVPTINTDDMLNPPGSITLENLDESKDDITKEDSNDTVEVIGKKELNTEISDLNNLSAYMIQIASISENKNIETLIEELDDHDFPHIVYKIDNMYKVYTFGSTKREDSEGMLDKVREVYPDAYMGQMHIPKQQVHYSNEENKGTNEVISDINSLIEILDQSSEVLYKYMNTENNIEEYTQMLKNHQKILEQISEKVQHVKLPLEFASVDDINKMINYQEKNISESFKIIEEKQDAYKLQNHFLDTLFRTIEVMKK